MKIKTLTLICLALVVVACAKNNTVPATPATPVTPVDPEATLHATGYKKKHLGHGLAENFTFKNPKAPGALPVKFDWRALGFDIPVKNQGGCGSCWAFGSVANIESASLIYSNKAISGSEQELVDCDNNFYGCNGGDFAGDYLVKNGVASEADYPYAAVNQKCKAQTKQKVLKAVNWFNLGSPDRGPTVEEIKHAIMQGGYITTVVNANVRWDSYQGGVMKGCKGKSLNHMVNIVGWTEDGNWIMRNSWSEKWGDKGYALMPFGCDNIGAEAAYVEIDNMSLQESY